MNTIIQENASKIDMKLYLLPGEEDPGQLSPRYSLVKLLDTFLSNYLGIQEKDQGTYKVRKSDYHQTLTPMLYAVRRCHNIFKIFGEEL